MQNEPPMNDPKTIWQNQPTEPSKMSLEEIRRRVKELQAKARKEFFLGCITMIIFFAFVALWHRRFHIQVYDPVYLVGYALSILWAIYVLYQMAKRSRIRGLPSEAGFTTSIEFLRRELERRCDTLRRLRETLFGPILLAIGAFVLPIVIKAIQGPGLQNTIPFFTLLATWIVAFLVIRNKELQKLRREIAELDAMTKESR